MTRSSVSRAVLLAIGISVLAGSGDAGAVQPGHWTGTVAFQDNTSGENQSHEIVIEDGAATFHLDGSATPFDGGDLETDVLAEGLLDSYSYHLDQYFGACRDHLEATGPASPEASFAIMVEAPQRPGTGAGQYKVFWPGIEFEGTQTVTGGEGCADGPNPLSVGMGEVDLFPAPFGPSDGLPPDPTHIVGSRSGVDTGPETVERHWQYSWDLHMAGSPDTDGDGLSDYLEKVRYGTDPDNADTDGDGFTDSEEITAGTDPLEPTSHPASRGGGAPGGGGGNPGGGGDAAGGGVPGGGVPGGAGGGPGRSRCSTHLTVTFAVYRAMSAPDTNECWNFDRPRGPGGFGQRRKWTGCGNEEVKATNPEKPGYWFYDDTAGLLDRVIPALTECAGRAAEEAGAASPSATIGYLFTAYRSAGRGSSLVPTASELAKVRSAVTEHLTSFYQVYDAQMTGSCPSFQRNCGSHPLFTPKLLSAWGQAPAGLVPMIDATPGPWSTTAELEEAVKEVCEKAVAHRIPRMAIDIGTGGSPSPEPVSPAESAAISTALRSCTE